MPATNVQRRWRGLWLMIIALLALVLWGATMALRRTGRPDDSIATDAASTGRGWPDMRIDVNSAGAAELALLPGVGERLGQRIVEDRQQHGRFATLDDLGRVPGVGAGTIERLRGYAVASPP